MKKVLTAVLLLAMGAFALHAQQKPPSPEELTALQGRNAATSHQIQQQQQERPARGQPERGKDKDKDKEQQ